MRRIPLVATSHDESGSYSASASAPVQPPNRNDPVGTLSPERNGVRVRGDLVYRVRFIACLSFYHVKHLVTF